MKRLAVIGMGVLACHALALWLVRVNTAQDVIAQQTPMVMLVSPTVPSPKSLNTLPTQAVKPADSPAMRSPAAQKMHRPSITPPTTRAETPLSNSTPQSPVTVATPPTGGSVQPAALGPPTAPRAEPSAAVGPPSARPVAPAIQLPSSNADYLNNPAPIYPPISQRLGEQGQVVVRVLIGKDGHAHQGEVHQSSGYDRLDQAALRAVMGWRFVPGQRGGVPQDMWFNVPISFTLK